MLLVSTTVAVTDEGAEGAEGAEAVVGATLAAAPRDRTVPGASSDISMATAAASMAGEAVSLARAAIASAVGRTGSALHSGQVLSLPGCRSKGC